LLFFGAAKANDLDSSSSSSSSSSSFRRFRHSCVHQVSTLVGYERKNTIKSDSIGVSVQ